MKVLTPQLTNILSSLTVIGDMYILLLLASLLMALFLKGKKAKNPLLTFANKNSLVIVFILSTIAMMGSLFYSEIAGYVPCVLCWYQRILMYPLPLLFGLAIAKKDTGIVDYGLALSGIGVLIAGYHYLMQISPSAFAPCSTVGYSVSCADKFFMTFGYITIPMMSLTAFAMIFLSLLTTKMKHRV